MWLMAPGLSAHGGLAIAVGLRRSRVLCCRGVVVPLLVVGKEGVQEREKERERGRGGGGGKEDEEEEEEEEREKQRGGGRGREETFQGHVPGGLLLAARPYLLVPHL